MDTEPAAVAADSGTENGDVKSTTVAETSYVERNRNAAPAGQREPVASGPERAKPRPLQVEIRRQLANVLPLAATDMICAAVIFMASAYLAGLHGTTAVHGARIALLLPALFMSLLLTGVYPGIGVGPVAELRKLWFGTTGLMSALLAAFAAQAGPMGGTLWFALFAWVGLLVVLPVARAFARSMLVRTSWWGEPVLVLGAGQAGRRVYAALDKHAARGIRPLGIVDTANEMWREGERDPALGGDCKDLRIGLAEELPALAERLHVYWAVIAHSDDPDHPTRDDWLTYASGLPHVLMETGDAATSLWSDSRECGPSHALYRPDQLAMGWPRVIKRTIDVALILLFSPIVFPLMLVLGVLVKVSSPDGPVFYGQRRIGRYGKVFTAWKFRTMVRDADALLSESLEADSDLRNEWLRDQKLKNDPRVIPGIGKLLRKTSLDELPQLWNVLRGDMSLVGPRPIVHEEIAKYGEHFTSFALVTPGITGLWQVSGRNDLDYQERVQLDMYYIRSWSPWMDIYILGKTVRTVLLREGAY